MNKGEEFALPYLVTFNFNQQLFNDKDQSHENNYESWQLAAPECLTYLHTH